MGDAMRLKPWQRWDYILKEGHVTSFTKPDGTVTEEMPFVVGPQERIQFAKWARSRFKETPTLRFWHIYGSVRFTKEGE